MMFNFLRVGITCLFILNCRGFNEDYDDHESDVQFGPTFSNSISRRAVSGTNVTNIANGIIYNRNNRNKENRNQFSSNSTKTKCKSDNVIFKKCHVAPFKEQQSATISLADLMKDYDEFYGGEQELSLREKVLGSTPRSDALVDNITEEPKPSFAMFYNLQPAVQQQITKINENVTQHRFWYILHDFPCWNLPILYAELIRHKHRTVFSLYGWKLDNVIDQGLQEANYKANNPSVSHTVNKWCEEEPCYGDHTLCLFNIKKNSKICKKSYQVEVPSITEQITIINIMNSMRNRVANGLSQRYSHLPPAANMRQVIYDYDLEKMSKVWLQQCLPGPAPCSSLDDNLVSELECTKFAKLCCSESPRTHSRCIPRTECFLYAVTGCIHIWFWRAGKKLTTTDIQCGRASKSTFDTVQLLWAKTEKIGCAHGENVNGDIRVVCNFFPGAPYFLDTKLYCGIISYDKLRQYDNYNNFNINEDIFLSLLGLKWNFVLATTTNKSYTKKKLLQQKFPKSSIGGVHILKKIYDEGWARKRLGVLKNGSYTWIARLVAKYKFVDKSGSRCDSDETIYSIGKPGSMCVENGRRFPSLCYDFRDPTPGYRLIAVLATIVLFSLILYDLFSGVVRQTNY